MELWVATSATSSRVRSHSPVWPLQGPRREPRSWCRRFRRRGRRGPRPGPPRAPPVRGAECRSAQRAAPQPLPPPPRPGGTRAAAPRPHPRRSGRCRAHSSSRAITASRSTSTTTPAATNAAPRSTRNAGRWGSVASQRPAARSGWPNGRGSISEAAAAATTTPQAASIQAAVRRSPRKASQTARAAACASGPSTCSTASERVTEYATTSTTPPTAAPIPSSTTVWRLSGATKSAPDHECEGEHEQQHREQLNALGDVGERRAEAADVPLDELHALRSTGASVRAPDAPAPAPPQAPRRRRNREHDGVPVPFEERAVDVAHRLAEQARERAASHDVGRHRLDDRTRRDQIGLVLRG